MTTLVMPVATRSNFNSQNVQQTPRAQLQNPPTKVGDVHTITFEPNQRGVDPVGRLGKVIVFGHGVPLGTHKVKIVHVGKNCLVARLDDTKVSSLVVGQTYMWLVCADGDLRFVEVDGRRVYVPSSAKPGKIDKFVFAGECPDDHHGIVLRARFFNQPPKIDKKIEKEAKQLNVNPAYMPVRITPVVLPQPKVISRMTDEQILARLAEVVDRKRARRALKGRNRKLVVYSKKMSRLFGSMEHTEAQIAEMRRLELLRTPPPKQSRLLQSGAPSAFEAKVAKQRNEWVSVGGKTLLGL